MKYNNLTNKVWADMVCQVVCETIGSTIKYLADLPKTESNYWVLVEALDNVGNCIKILENNPSRNFRVLTPVKGRSRRKGFNVSVYQLQLLEIAIDDEIQKRNILDLDSTLY